jgi:hypothetical protein
MNLAYFDYAATRRSPLIRSVSKMMEHLAWPRDPILSNPRDNPSDSTINFANAGLGGALGTFWDNIQGFTSDGTTWCWFVTEQHVWQFPLSVGRSDNVAEALEDPSWVRVFSPFDGDPSFRETTLGSKNYDHVGAPSYFNGRLYLPFEAKDGTPPALVELDAEEMKYSRHWKLNHPDFPWCAVNPFDGGRYLYTSPFFDEPGGLTLSVFEPFGVPGGRATPIEPVAHIPLFDENGGNGDNFPHDSDPRLWVQSIQGGAFSNRGHLYLAVQAAGPTLTLSTPFISTLTTLTPGGIMAFDMLTGRRILNQPVAFVLNEQELEGMSVVDLAGSFGGQVHTIVNHDQWAVWFKHWDADPELV